MTSGEVRGDAGEPRRCAGDAAAEAGRHTKICRRLGVSPAPVALNGPVTVSDSTCGWPDGSIVSNELRMKGWRRTVVGGAGGEKGGRDDMVACLQGDADIESLLDVVAAGRRGSPSTP
jgi:hypothetical protein